MLDRNPTSYVMKPSDAVVAMKRCIFSELVTNNEDYFKEMCRVRFDVDGNDNTVNAYAGHYDDGTPGIILLQGMLNWTSLLSNVVVALMRGNSMSRCRRMMRWTAEATLTGEITYDTVCDFEDEFGIVCNGYDCEVQRSIGIAILAGVLAHESGHICLRHSGYEVNTPTVHRNEERSADLFAASLFASGGTSVRDVISCIVTFVGFRHLNLAKEREKNSKKRTRADKLNEKKLKKIDEGWETHPCTEERIKLWLKSFEAYFKKSDITPTMILQLAEM